MANAKRDENRIPTLLAVSSADSLTPVVLEAEPVNKALNVNITGGSSSGTEYTEGDVDASITGTAILWEDAANTLVAVSSAKPLPVSASIDTTGLATSAKQLPDGHNVTIDNSTGGSAVNIQDGGNTITVDGTVAVTNADIGSIKTAVEVIDNAISGNEMQVDIVGALPAGTNILGLVDNIPTDYELAGNTLHVSKYYTSTGAATDGVVWSPAAGKRWYITDIIINVSAAATVTLEDDLTAGDSVVFKAELGANSGISHSFNTPLFSGEDAADLIITTSAGNVYVTVTGYEI